MNVSSQSHWFKEDSASPSGGATTLAPEGRIIYIMSTLVSAQDLRRILSSGMFVSGLNTSRVAAPCSDAVAEASEVHGMGAEALQDPLLHCR